MSTFESRFSYTKLFLHTCIHDVKCLKQELCYYYYYFCYFVIAIRKWVRHLCNRLNLLFFLARSNSKKPDAVHNIVDFRLIEI